MFHNILSPCTCLIFLFFYFVLYLFILVVFNNFEKNQINNNLWHLDNNLEKICFSMTCSHILEFTLAYLYDFILILWLSTFINGCYFFNTIDLNLLSKNANLEAQWLQVLTRCSREKEWNIQIWKSWKHSWFSCIFAFTNKTRLQRISEWRKLHYYVVAIVDYKPFSLAR